MVLAGIAAGSDLTVSVARGLEGPLAALSAQVRVCVEDAAAWSQRLRGPQAPHRVRLLGGERTSFASASLGRPDIALYAQPVVASGRIELLPFLHEQAVSVTAHRFGSPIPALADVL